MYNVYVPHDITEMLIVAGAKVNVVKGLPGMTGGTYRAMASYVEARGDTARAISLYETAADYFDAAVVAITSQKRAKRNALAKSLALGLLDTLEQQTLLPAMQGSHPHATVHSQIMATKLASGQAFRDNSTPPSAHSDPSQVRGKAYDIQRHAEACRRQAELLRNK